MSLTKLWTIGAVFVMALAVVATWFLGISPQLDSIQNADTQRQGVEQQNAANQAALNQLIQESKGMDSLKGNLAALRKSVPDTADMSTFIAQIGAAAKDDKVTVAAITVGQAAYYAKPAPKAAPASPSAGPTKTKSDAGAGSSQSAAPGSTAPGGTANGTSAAPTTNSLITGKNFVTIPVTVTVTGSGSQVLNFTSDMQHGARLFLVNTLTTAPATSGTNAGSASGNSSTPTNGIQAVLGGFVYVLLQDGSDGTLASVSKLATAQASGAGADTSTAETAGTASKGSGDGN